MSATHHAHVVPLALAAVLAVLSVGALATGIWFYFNDRDRVMFDWRGPVHFDEAFGLAGLFGCVVAALAHVAFFFAEVF